MTPGISRAPALRGGLLALAAALLFGASTPLVQLAGRDAGPFAVGALLYAGAALAGWLLRRPAGREAALRRGDGRWLLGMAAFGALLAPAALAFGLQHASATAASLLLTLEALFTAVLARLAHGETLDRRIALAMALLLAGGLVLVLGHGRPGSGQSIGLLAVLVATAAWAVDNTLSRRLAERDPSRVVMVKSLLGLCAGVALSGLLREPWPASGAALSLLAIGASAYGLSLRLYLLAQRAFGAARTASVFAFAPFIGAAVALALGDRGGGWPTAIAGLLMAIGVLLHLAESHSHEHEHAALAHEHAHRHDDGHHDHWHDPMPVGPHSHPHRHRPLRHAHAHVPDIHHGHSH